MATAKFKVESGIQLLARLTKKSEIENFYPNLFQSGPTYGDIIEMFSEVSMSNLLTDLICEALIPANSGGPQLSVLIVSTDGNLNYEHLVSYLRYKLHSRTETICDDPYNRQKVHKACDEALVNLKILKIYDATQFYTTIHNLEGILMEHSNISLLIFDTLTAFYWSEQGFKMTKMDMYIRNLLQLIRRITKDYKITILYTRPEYFSSSKDAIESLEPCSKFPKADRINYRIQLLFIGDKSYEVIVRTFNTQFKKQFTIVKSQVMWM